MNHLHLKRLISIGFTVLGAGLALLGSRISDICIWIGFALLVISIIINLTICCPHCGHNLIIRRWTLPKFCPECGHPIDDSKFEE